MKILIVGAGAQGGPCASILSKDPAVSQIKIGDINETVLKRVADRIGSEKVVTEKVDASSIDSVVAAAQGMDAIIDLVTPIFFENVLLAALKAGTHYVNTAWEETIYEGFDTDHVQLTGRFKYAKEFEAKGLTAIMGCGMSSGYTTNVLTRYYVDKLDTVESIKLRLGKRDLSVSEEEEILKPWNPGWNPRQAILDFVIPTYKFEDGKFVYMEEPFSEPEVWEFPEPVGKQLVTHHAHEEPFSMPFAFREKGLKYCDFKYYVSKQIAPVLALGLGSDHDIDVKGVKVKPLDVLISRIPQTGDAFLEEDPSQFEFLDKTKFVSIMLEIKGKKDGRNTTYLIHIPSTNTPRRQMYDTYGTSLITVALPAVIGTKMAIEGTEKGIIHPHDLNPNRFLELLRASGYKGKWEEKVIVE